MEIVTLRAGLDKKIARRKHLWTTIQQETKELDRLEAKITKIQEAQDHLQKLAQAVQQQAHGQIAKIVTKCMGSVFDDMYQLNIEFVRLRGKTEAKLVYLKGDHEVNPLLTSGGVLDVTALALRVANLVLSDPQPRQLLVLDEPFTGVDANNLPKVCAVIDGLAHELGIQFLIVTHCEQLQIGKVIQI